MARNRRYTVKIKRKRLGITNYNKRLSYLASNLPRIVIRLLTNTIVIQLVNYNPKGDHVALTVTSDHLKKLGWKAHKGSIPSAYLTGLLFGVHLKTQKIVKAIADAGPRTPIKGSRFYAAIKGIKDGSSIQIPCSEEVIPNEEAITGKKIADYASMLSKDPSRYEKQFSGYLKNNFKPELFPHHFNEIKNKILGGSFKSGSKTTD